MRMFAFFGKVSGRFCAGLAPEGRGIRPISAQGKTTSSSIPPKRAAYLINIFALALIFIAISISLSGCGGKGAKVKYPAPKVDEPIVDLWDFELVDGGEDGINASYVSMLNKGEKLQLVYRYSNRERAQQYSIRIAEKTGNNEWQIRDFVTEVSINRLSDAFLKANDTTAFIATFEGGSISLCSVLNNGDLMIDPLPGQSFDGVDLAIDANGNAVAIYPSSAPKYLVWMHDDYSEVFTDELKLPDNKRFIDSFTIFKDNACALVSSSGLIIYTRDDNGWLQHHISTHDDKSIGRNPTLLAQTDRLLIAVSHPDLGKIEVIVVSEDMLSSNTENVFQHTPSSTMGILGFKQANERLYILWYAVNFDDSDGIYLSKKADGKWSTRKMSPLTVPRYRLELGNASVFVVYHALNDGLYFSQKEDF